MKSLHYIAALFLLCSCTEEIQLDYRPIDPLYVIEGHVSNEGSEVVITGTRDIDDPVLKTGGEVQSVVLSSDNGIKETLTYREDGTYRSLSFIGIPGQTYTLTVIIDGESFTSSSTMPGITEIVSTRMRWEEMMGNDMLHLIVDVRDKADDINYYYYRILRNGKLFKWNVMRDLDSSNHSVQFDISCMNRDKAEKNDPEDYDSILFEGDDITIEVRAIDMKAYDYLFSAKLSGQNPSNPVYDFDGEVLGYFSAYTSTSKSFVFHYSDIED